MSETKKTALVRVDREGLRMLISAKSGLLSRVICAEDMPPSEAIARIDELNRLADHLDTLVTIEDLGNVSDPGETAP